MSIFLFVLILSVYIYFLKLKSNELSVSALTVGGSYEVTIVYAWYSVLLEHPGVYLGLRRLIEVLR